MKKFFLFFAFLFVTAMASAQCVNFDDHAHGTISFRDGHEETYDWVKLPNLWSDKIVIKKDGKKKEKINAENILCITYWNERQPEKKHTIYRLTIEDPRNNGRMVCIWGMPIMGNKWGVVFHVYDYYQFDPESGDFYQWVMYEQSWEKLAKPGLQEWQTLLLQRADKDYAVVIGYIRNYNDRKTKETVTEYIWPNERATEVAKIFKENPEVYQQILDGTLKASDLQYILDQM